MNKQTSINNTNNHHTDEYPESYHHSESDSSSQRKKKVTIPSSTIKESTKNKSSKEQYSLQKDEIEQIIQNINKTNKVKSKVIVQDTEKRFDIIDLYTTNKKSHINKCEVILSILEVLVNWKKYGFHKYNKDIWNKVVRLKLGNKIFEELNLTMLKKFSSRLKRIKDKSVLPALVKKYQYKIENQE
jgi:hypothetical protein